MKLYSLGGIQAILDDFIASLVLVVLATLCVLIRLWARHARRVALWIDDYTIICSLLLLYVLFAIEIADFGVVANPLQNDRLSLTPIDQMQISNMMLVAYQLVYGTTLALGKASYLLFYRRIFVSEPFVRATWVLLGFVILWYIANVLQVFLICRPFNSNWDVEVKAICGNRPLAYTIIGAINMATDFVIMIIPVHFIRQLQMPTSSKIGVSLIFMIGILICAISIVRMVILSKLDFDDISYDMLDSVFWTVVEPSLVIINACIPTMRPVIHSAFVTFWHKTPRPSRQIQLDEYPLTDERDVLHTAKVTADLRTDPGDKKREGSSQARTDTDRADCGKPRAGVIHVQREWNVSE